MILMPAKSLSRGSSGGVTQTRPSHTINIRKCIIKVIRISIFILPLKTAQFEAYLV